MRTTPSGVVLGVAWVGRSLVVVRRSLDGHLTVTSRFVFGFESDGWGSSVECVVASADEGLEGDLGGFDALEFGEFGGDGFEVSDGVSGGGESCGVVG